MNCVQLQFAVNLQALDFPAFAGFGVGKIAT
nr:MAG TPA: hypothetical protein [Caudoviricetes sp.]